MFIRWIVRGHKNAEVADVTFHDAYLVESYRDDNGEPRQRIISYLGNIRQMGDDFPGIERELFLLRAELIMECISDLSAHDCEHVLKQLHQKVPPLTPDEVRMGFQNTIGWYMQWWCNHGQAPTRDEMIQMIERAQSAHRPVLAHESNILSGG